MTRRTEPDLDARLAAAFADGATEDTVAALIEETESAARAAGDAAEQAVSRLRERLTEVQGAEEDARRHAAYEEARAERDKLAAEFARVYPPLAAQLADLLGRLRAGAGLCWSPSWWRAGWMASFGIRSMSRASFVAFSCQRSNTTFTRPTRGRDPRASRRGA